MSSGGEFSNRCDADQEGNQPSFQSPSLTRRKVCFGTTCRDRKLHQPQIVEIEVNGETLSFFKTWQFEVAPYLTAIREQEGVAFDVRSAKARRSACLVRCLKDVGYLENNRYSYREHLQAWSVVRHD